MLKLDSSREAVKTKAANQTSGLWDIVRHTSFKNELVINNFKMGGLCKIRYPVYTETTTK